MSSQPPVTSSSHSHAGNRQQPASQPGTSPSAGSAGHQPPSTLAQPSSWAQAGSSRQLPASFQGNTANAAKPTSSGLRIKLNTNSARQQQQSSQGLTNHHMTNGHSHASLHPADPHASSSARLAAAAMRPPGPSNLGTKRKHYELNGHYGSYSQASAQAAGMSMSDHLQQAANRSSGSRLPPYPDTSISYGSRAPYGSGPVISQPSQPPSQSTSAYGYPVSPNYWQHQHPVGSPSHGPSIGSPAYGSSMPASPPYSPLYPSSNGNLQQAMQNKERARDRDAAFLQSMHQQPPYGSGALQWNAQSLADGEL